MSHSGTRPPGYLPAMGRDVLLPLYDPFTRLIGRADLDRLLIAQAGIGAGDRVLEIGCGTGTVAVLAQRLHPGAEVGGIDPDPKALARARRKARRAGLAMRWDLGYAQDLPYPDGSFDRLLSSLMFHHLQPEQRSAALREAFRVLAPGGRLHLLDIGGDGAAHDGLMARLHRHSPRLHDNLGDRIPELMREAGFAPAVAVDHRVRRLFGPLTYYRADVPVT